ncbi:RidA family protein [Streptomyces sp. NPDC004284]|uniref:RidA family protein n=1 Tax=Streptomyces sp. NPDC004284 TaxID=3364695 RepID=UPI00368BDD6D
MGRNIRERLAELGLTLPGASAPKGAYVPAVRSGRLVFIAGQIPLTDGELTATGRVGAEVSPESAKELSRQCALAALAAADSVVPLEAVTGVVKVVGYVSSAPGFLGQPTVVDGASELLIDVFGDAGRHARSVVGMAVLPLDAPVEIEIVLEAAEDVAV